MYNPTKPYLKTVNKYLDKPSDNMFVHVDGIGTKGKWHWLHRSFYSAAKDAFAMNINDFLMHRAVPILAADHLILPTEDHKAIKSVLHWLSRLCKSYSIKLVAGETAIHNNIDGMEISLTMIGHSHPSYINQCQPHDVILGFASNGLHSNGFSALPDAYLQRYGEDITTPTFIYYGTLYPICFLASGLMHITGGAYAKLKQILPSNLDIHFTRLVPRYPFDVLYEYIADDKTMYTTFNCGIGFMLSVPQQYVEVIKTSVQYAFDVQEIGHVIEGSGNVHIESAFSSATITL